MWVGASEVSAFAARARRSWPGWGPSDSSAARSTNSCSPRLAAASDCAPRSSCSNRSHTLQCLAVLDCVVQVSCDELDSPDKENKKLWTKSQPTKIQGETDFLSTAGFLPVFSAIQISGGGAGQLVVPDRAEYAAHEAEIRDKLLKKRGRMDPAKVKMIETNEQVCGSHFYYSNKQQGARRHYNSCMTGY